MFGKKEKEEVRPMTANQVFEVVKSALDSNDIKYNPVPEKMLIQTGVMGDDLPIAMNIQVSEITIRFSCLLNFKAAVDNYSKVAWELNCINKGLIFGAFYLDPDDGYVIFEDSFPYKEANVSESFILAFAKMIVSTVDEYDGDLKQIAEKSPRSSDPGFGNMYS